MINSTTLHCHMLYVDEMQVKRTPWTISEVDQVQQRMSDGDSD